VRVLTRRIGVAALAVLVLALPLVLSPFGVSVATEIFILAVFAMSLGLIIGYAGLISLGHAAFFGTGAYTVAVLGGQITNTYLLLVAALCFSGALAFVSGLLFFRSSGTYFLMLTLALGQVLFAIAFQFEALTGGGDGMSVAAVPNLGAGEVVGELSLYYLMGVTFLLCYVLLRVFVDSPAGKAVRGTKENELRMRALGYNVRSYKLMVYTLSGTMAGLAGSLYAYFNVYVTPELFNWAFSGEALIMVIVGGSGTLLGPAIGAGVVIALENYLSSYTDRWALILGLIFVAFVLVGRGGVIHLLHAALKAVIPSRLKHAGERKPASPARAGEEEGVR
jgi:branched-chain amino acid transport system permease protein